MRIPGFDIDFSTELSTVRFREHVSPVGMGVAIGHLASDALTKLWADPQGRYLLAIRITNAAKQEAEYTLIPFANVAFFRVKAPAAARQPTAKRAEVPA